MAKLERRAGSKRFPREDGHPGQEGNLMQKRIWPVEQITSEPSHHFFHTPLADTTACPWTTKAGAAATPRNEPIRLIPTRRPSKHPVRVYDRPRWHPAYSILRPHQLGPKNVRTTTKPSRSPGFASLAVAGSSTGAMLALKEARPTR
jgi:hypothetical protein